MGVITNPETVHTEVVALVNATVNPKDEVGATVTVPAFTLRFEIDPNVIVCEIRAKLIITTPLAPAPPAVRCETPS
jgi:hypothetical protein